MVPVFALRISVSIVPVLVISIKPVPEFSIVFGSVFGVSLSSEVSILFFRILPLLSILTVPLSILVMLPAIEPSLSTLIIPFLLFFKTEPEPPLEFNSPLLFTFNVPAEL